MEKTIQELKDLWRVLFNERLCKNTNCEVCCWQCELLPLCFEKWEELGEKVSFECFCYKAQAGLWCSRAREAYRLLLKGESYEHLRQL